MHDTSLVLSRAHDSRVAGYEPYVSSYFPGADHYAKR